MARFAREEDFDFVKKLWEVCFDDTPQFVEWNFDKNYSCINTIISDCDGEGASVMQLMPYKMMFGGKEFSVRYVSGVATLPKFRGRGLVRGLFEFGIPQMYDMGCDISILIPAVSGMYEKLGYRTVCRREFYTAYALPNGKVIKEYSKEIIPVLDKIYQNDMEGKSAHIKRCKWDWERILTDLLTLSGGAVVINDDIGYALCYPKDSGYEVAEICGEICIDAKVTEQPPIMARVINVSRIKANFAPLFDGVATKDGYIASDNIEGEDVMDIAEFTEIVFDKIKEEFNKDMYINLLL